MIILSLLLLMFFYLLIAGILVLFLVIAWKVCKKILGGFAEELYKK